MQPPHGRRLLFGIEVAPSGSTATCCRGREPYIRFYAIYLVVNFVPDTQHVFKIATGVRSLNARFDISPGSAFCIVLTGGLAILDVVGVGVEAGVVTAQPVPIVVNFDYESFDDYW